MAKNSKGARFLGMRTGKADEIIVFILVVAWAISWFGSLFSP